MLAPGARIAVVSPAGVSTPERLAAGVALLEEWGYRPELLPHAKGAHRYLAGTDDERLGDLVHAFSGAYAAVWMARGGYGLSRIVPRLRWENLASIPVFGFSDGTVLLNAAAARGRPAVHAPVLHALASHNDDASRAWLRSFLSSAEPLEFTGRPLVAGPATGPLVGGNLCVLASLCGTALQVRGAGAVVLLEDLGEPPYKLDRLLTQCRAAGVFDGARAVLLGEFLDANPPAGATWTLDEIFLDVLGDLGIPIVAGLPIGHGRTNLALPLGGRVAVEASGGVVVTR